MMNKLSKYLLIFVLHIIGHFTYAQDVLFSQFHNTPILTNSALTAIDTNIHIGLNLRQQRISSGENITTTILSGSYPIWRNNLSLGFSIFNDNLANFINTTGANLSIAYRRLLGKNHFSIGLQGGYFQQGLQLDNLITDNQLLTGTFDPNASLNDNFANNQAQYPLLSSGFFWYQQKDSSNVWKYFLGISFNNFNTPNFQFTESGNGATIPLNSTLYGGLLAFQNSTLSIHPSFRWVNRLRENIFNIGTDIKYYFNSNQIFLDNSNISLGSWYQSNQQLTLLVGFEHPKYKVNLSYDFALSDAQQNIASGGVFELTIRASLPKKYRPRRIDSSSFISENIMVKKELESDTFLIEEKDRSEQIYYVSYKNPLGQDSIVIQTIWEKSWRENITDMEEKEDTLLIIASEIEFEYATIHFKKGDSTLEETAQYLLEPILIYMQLDSTLVVEVKGHTSDDEAIGKEYELSLSRVQMVKRYLINQGIDPKRIRSYARGPFDPIQPNTTPSGREANRRVELSIIK